MAHQSHQNAECIFFGGFPKIKDSKENEGGQLLIWAEDHIPTPFLSCNCIPKEQTASNFSFLKQLLVARLGPINGGNTASGILDMGNVLAVAHAK